MDRRQFVQTGVAAGVVATRAAAAKPRAPSRRPNVLYVFDDEHRWQSMPGEPYSDAVVAPNIDAFRKANFSMERCISNYPLCSPYRGILMTGQWPFQNGITRNWLELGTSFESIGHAFDKGGYHTAYVGKWHLSGPGHDRAFIPAGPHRQGFEDWHVWGAVDKHMDYSFTFNPDTGEKIQPMGYQATLMTDQAVKIIHEQQHAEKPWMMVVSWHPPHFPVDDAPPEDENFFKAKEVALRPNVKSGGKGALASEESLKDFHRGYYAHIRAIDREFGRLLKALDESGQANNTIVVFTSDHGEMGGSHGRMHKRVPHEESIRVPFYVRYSGVTPKGKKSDKLFSSIDIYPTLCGLAGIAASPAVKGKDLSGVMRGKDGPEQEVVFLMNCGRGGDDIGEGPAPPDFRGLRSKTHTYAVAYDGKWFLYDNEKDPYQQHNLIDEPSLQAMVEDFNKRIAAWLKDADDPFDFTTALGKKSVQPV